MNLQKAAWIAAVVPMAAFSADNADKSQEEMQRALNERVMATPFNPGDIKKAQGWAEEAKKQGVIPVAQPPSYWVPGWSCANLTTYTGYLYGDYRNCIYYHHYYGRYWR